MYQSTLGAALERRFVCLGRRAIPAALVFVVNSAWAQAPTAPAACDPAPATAASVQGTVEAQRVGNAQWQPVKLNDKFCPGDTIRVGEKSRADIALLNQSVLRLNANRREWQGDKFRQVVGFRFAGRGRFGLNRLGGWA